MACWRWERAWLSADKNSCVPWSLEQKRVSLAACLMLKDSDACFLPHSTFITLAGYTGTQHASVSDAHFAWSYIITGYVCCFCNYSVLWFLAHHTLITLLLPVFVCSCRGLSTASGWYLDAGWRWPSGAPFPCPSPWSSGLPTHHTTRGWHHWGHTLLSQAGVHGEGPFNMSWAKIYRPMVTVMPTFTEQCIMFNFFFSLEHSWGFLSTRAFNHLIINS